MSLAKEVVKSVSRLNLRRRILRIVYFSFGTMFVLQVITVAALWVVSVIRKRKLRSAHFPHPRLDEVEVEGNYIQLYAYGRDLYDDMLEAIDNAKESIYIESYIWKDDEVGWEFKSHLAQKAAEGVEVYVIFDSFGNLVVPRDFKNFPKPIHTLEYHAIGRPWHAVDPRHYSLDHRKILVVDGKTAFVGGFNIGSLYATQWRDTHMRIKGPDATDLAQSFVDFWNRGCPEDPIEVLYPRRFDPHISLHGNDALRLIFPIRDTYISAIDQAQKQILLTNAYFVPDRALLDSLKDAAKRGVDVRVLVPWKSNHIEVDWLTRGYFTECLEAGIRVLGYSYAMLHAKTCTIDGEWSTIGTANLDRLSAIGNYEVNIEIYSAALAQQMEELFRCDTQEVFELTLENWRKRAWYLKLSERILAPLRYIL